MSNITSKQRSEQKNQKPFLVWLTGLSGAGKTTLAQAFDQHLHSIGKHTFILDGDILRDGLNKDLGFSEEDRAENLRRVTEVAALMLDAGLIVVAAFISPYESARQKIRERIGDERFIEVYVSTPLEECENRDPKGLYKKARAGEIKGFTGIDDPYESPLNPDLNLNTSGQSVYESLELLVNFLMEKSYL